MKELSFLMFMIALLFGVMVLARHLTNPNHPDRAVFFVPSRMLFNLLWGSIFYIGYGILMYPEPLIKIGLSILNGILLSYTLILISLKKYLLAPQKNMPKLVKQFLERRITAQQEVDKQTPHYTQRKALKILGLAPYALENPDLIKERISILRQQAQNNLKSEYFPTILEHCENSLIR